VVSTVLVQAEYEKERFKLPGSLMLAAREDGAGPEPPKKKRRMGGSTATGPVKEEDDKEKVVLWRVNRDEFNKRLRLRLLRYLPHMRRCICTSCPESAVQLVVRWSIPRGASVSMGCHCCL
jgi:hypothetical protein